MTTRAVRYTDTDLIRRLLDQARPFWPHIGAVFVLGLLATPLALLLPLPLKIAVDSVVGSDPLPGFLAALVPAAVTESSLRLLVFSAVLQVLIVLLMNLRNVAANSFSTWTGEQLTLGFRARLFEHIQRLSLAFHDTRGTADSIYRIQYDAPAIQWLVIDTLVPLISSVVMFAAMLFVTLRINALLAVLALAILPILAITAWIYRRCIRPRYTEAKRLESDALHVVQEVLGAVRVVKAFGRERHEHERFVTHLTRTANARVRIALSEGVFRMAVDVTVAIGTAATLFVGIQGVQTGALSLGELLIVLAYIGQLYDPLKNLSNTVSTIQFFLASGQRALEIMDELPEVRERPDAWPLARAAGALEFRATSFGYSDGPTVLQDISMAVPAGTCVGVAGPTGAGKTTLISLLVRLYDPTSGSILLDGTDLRDYKLADLRQQFAIVLQEPVLFSTTIAENIAYASPTAGLSEIVEVAKAADAHRFISDLPHGYYTLVGERGMTLSGGERQRIALARAFLKDAPILILDEPTSAVDIGTETVIVDAITRLMRGRTTFVIAHRLSTLKSCDMLLQLAQGRVALLTTEVAATLRHLASETASPSLFRGKFGSDGVRATPQAPGATLESELNDR
jgi:ATP-binding cassette, subfamily B, bacterial